MTQSIASLPQYKMKSKGVLLISPLLAAQITALHAAWPKEWSGMLFFRPISEDLSNPENFRAVAEACYPMDFGSETYTEYDFSAEEVLECYERYPKGDPAAARPSWKMGHIHTHHTMSTFFSGTDDRELTDNVDKYNYYLSLIVNVRGQYCAKIAYLAETERKVKVKNKPSFRTETERVVVTMELEVKMMLDEWFHQRLRDVGKASATRHVPKQTYSYNSPHTVRNTPSQHQHTQGGQRFMHNVESIPRGKGLAEGESKIRAAIRMAIPYLLLKDPDQAKEVQYYNCFEKLEKVYPTPPQREGYIGWVLGKFDAWFDKYLAQHIDLENDNESAIAWTVHNYLTMFDKTNPLVIMMDLKLSKKLDLKYRNSTKLLAETNELTDGQGIVINSDVTQSGPPNEDKSYEQIQNQIGFGYGGED